ncbi:MAG: alanyl-tRNA editing protein [Oscillospiraceae bacterium]|nr:alanyl-tRNA editing protein [Oscillospiraceae bacterium]MBQ9251012.1 alanyl-tRNA editing protein [Oscillospiraceae bacterium]
MTEKLYDIDSGIFAFTARVTGCEPAGKGYALRLDRTAFFPEGGGQQADTGSIGEARVLDVQEEGGEIRHYTDKPLAVGAEVSCVLDKEQRRRRMQNHSGEHVISGLIHGLYGWDNVGFHMGESYMTMDYSGELSWEELMRVETLANEAVRDDLPIRAWYPEPEQLQDMVYRSKLDLTENVRIVEIPGIDRCACCAPHVSSTGQIGAVKILTAERHRGGTRITALCGLDAMEDYRARQESVSAISALLSAKREEVAPAVERLLGERDRLKERVAALSMELVRLRAESVAPTEGNLCLFDTVLDEVAQRELVNLLMERCSGAAAVFCGDDENGYRYIIGSLHADLRAAARNINAAIGGRGGGSPAMIQGRAAAKAAEIRAYFDSASI